MTKRIVTWSLVALMVVAGMLFVTVSARADVPEGIATGLVSCWEFDEESGTRYDSYGANHLTEYNTVSFVGTGISGNAVHFISDNDEYLSIADNASLSVTNDNLTVVSWGTVSGADTETYSFYRKVNSYDLYCGTARTSCVFRYGTAAISKAFTVEADVWYFFAGRRNGTTLSLQVNDLSIATNEGAIDITDNTNPLDVGKYSATAFLDGNEDLLAIWKRALSDDEIAWLYNSGAGRSCDTMISASNPTATPTITPTTTQTPTATAVLSATSTPDVRTTEVVTLPSGSTFIVERTFTYGDMAVFTVIGLALVIAIIYGSVRLVKLWL